MAGFVALGAVLLAALYVCWLMFRPFFNVLLWAGGSSAAARPCNELLIFFAVLGGLQVFGVLGLVLGPVVVAMTLALIEMVRQAGQPPSETLRKATVMEEQSNLRDVGPAQ